MASSDDLSDEETAPLTAEEVNFGPFKCFMSPFLKKILTAFMVFKAVLIALLLIVHVIGSFTHSSSEDSSAYPCFHGNIINTFTNTLPNGKIISNDGTVKYVIYPGSEDEDAIDEHVEQMCLELYKQEYKDEPILVWKAILTVCMLSCSVAPPTTRNSSNAIYYETIFKYNQTYEEGKPCGSILTPKGSVCVNYDFFAQPND